MSSPRNGTTSTTQTSTEVNPILRLRNREEGSSRTSENVPSVRSRPGVRWTDDVVDNEHMDKKKSKICCIFHPQKEFGESSDESSSDSSSDSSEDENEGPKPQDDHVCSHGHHHKKKKERKSRPNAYERQPNYSNKSKVPDHKSS